MTFLEALTDDLKRDEGFCRSAYQDSEGIWTIGYGRMIDASLNGGINQDEAIWLLHNDIRRIFFGMETQVPWVIDLPEPAKRALVNMLFNLGWPRLSGFKKMLAALEADDFELAADEALDSKWARQVGDRAERIADLFRQATWASRQVGD